MTKTGMTTSASPAAAHCSPGMDSAAPVACAAEVARTSDRAESRRILEGVDGVVIPGTVEIESIESTR